MRDHPRELTIATSRLLTRGVLRVATGANWQCSIENDMKQSFITFPTKAKGSFNKDQSSLSIYRRLFVHSPFYWEKGACTCFACFFSCENCSWVATQLAAW
jgi:hypothetical protein